MTILERILENLEITESNIITIFELTEMMGLSGEVNEEVLESCTGNGVTTLTAFDDVVNEKGMTDITFRFVEKEVKYEDDTEIELLSADVDGEETDLVKFLDFYKSL